MTTGNINLNKEEKVNKRRKRKCISKATLLFEITEYMLAFFMNKITLIGALSPFGISYFASTFPSHYMSFGTIAAFLGILFTGFGISSLKYIAALSLYLLFVILYNKDLSEKKWLSATACSLSLFTAGMVFVVSEGFLLYDTLLLLLEAIISFLSFFAFDKASVLVRTVKNRKYLEPSEVLSLVFLYSALVLSVSSIEYLESAGHVLSVCAVLIISLSSGFELSTATGLLLGTVMSLNSPLPAQIICTYTVSALVSGLFRKYGKVGVSFAFIFANSVVTIYLNASSLTIIDIFCTLSAILVVLLIPKSVFSHISQITSTPLFNFTQSRDKRILQSVTQNLEDASKSFSELSSVFSNLTESTKNSDELSAVSIFDAVFDDVCRNCTLCTYCWHKNYDKTSADLSSLYNSMSDRGTATEFDAPCDFRSQCIKFDDFLEAVNKNYEIHKINLRWASKVHESKLLVSRQFENISSVLTCMKRKFQKGFEFDEMLEGRIRSALDKKGICAEDIKVSMTDYCEVSLTISQREKEEINSSLVASSIGAVLETPVFCIKKNINDTSIFFKFREKANYSLETGFARTSPDGNSKSGDSHAFMPLEDGKYVLCLSDGMGHGKEASMQSKATTELVKKLLSSGFDKETALKIINTFLLFKSRKETFATADICVVNLYSCAIEFIKSGAVSSFIKTDDGVNEIKCSSLPAGAVSELHADCELVYGVNGNYIIMATDGISDVLVTDKENTLIKIIENFKGTSPQELADEIIMHAIAVSSDKIHDDMTVLVSKISENL